LQIKSKGKKDGKVTYLRKDSWSSQEESQLGHLHMPFMKSGRIFVASDSGECVPLSEVKAPFMESLILAAPGTGETNPEQNIKKE
jgi:hypothetical protein